MGPVGRRLLRDVPAGRPQLALGVAAGLLASACVVAQAYLLAHVVAGAVVDRRGLDTLGPSLGWLAAVVVARGLLLGVFDLSGRVAAGRAAVEVRRRLLAALLGRRPVHLHGAQEGDVVTAATAGVDALEPFYAAYLPQAVLAIAVPVGVLGAVAPVDLRSAAILASTVPLVPVFMVLVGKAAEARSRASFAMLGRLSSHFLDLVRGLTALRAHNRAEAQLEAVRAVGERYRSETMATLRIAFLSAFVLELVAMLATAVVAVTVGVRLVQGGIGLEAGLVVLILAPEVYVPLRQLGVQYHAATDGLSAAERLFAVVDLPEAVPVPPHPVGAPDPRRVPVVLEGVTVVYPGGAAPAVRGLDLVLEPGEVVAVTGPSGSGKSTLGLLLVRLLAPTSGRILAGGIDLADVDPAEWRRRVAWVPQRPTLVSGTIADNVRLGRPGATDAEVGEALTLAEAPHLVPLLAEPVGEGGRGLSVGERRRVAIARALVSDASLVVLDEPTADLDALTAAAVAEAVWRIADDRTVVLITHAGGLAARADRALEIVEGRVVHAARAEGVTR